MAILDFLKNKKEADNAKERKVAKASVIKKEGETKEVKKEVKASASAKASARQAGGAQKFSYTVVKAPHISEKANDLSAQNKYTFVIYANANKPEIKKSIEGIYGVDVVSLNTIRIPHKKRRLGKTQGYKKAYNKVIVTIKAGQKIEIF